jgi:hypothetical protein
MECSGRKPSSLSLHEKVKILNVWNVFFIKLNTHKVGLNQCEMKEVLRAVLVEIRTFGT